MNVRVLLALLLAPLAAVAADKPNVIFILADDLGAHDLGCFGSTFYETPNLDRLAKRGTRFTQAYAALLAHALEHPRRPISGPHWHHRAGLPSADGAAREKPRRERER
jgi:hypothetical protein